MVSRRPELTFGQVRLLKDLLYLERRRILHEVGKLSSWARMGVMAPDMVLASAQPLYPRLREVNRLTKRLARLDLDRHWEDEAATFHPRLSLEEMSFLRALVMSTPRYGSESLIYHHPYIVRSSIVTLGGPNKPSAVREELLAVFGRYLSG